MNQLLPISAAIITLNEEKNLQRCLESVRSLVSEIIVIDSGSTDGTHAVAKKFGARFEIHPWRGHIGQKNIALQCCTQPWVLCLDADEAISPELADSIRKNFKNGEPRENGFYVNRLNFYLGKWIRHGWNPEWRLRFVRKNGAQWRGLDPHDKLETNGPIGHLRGDLLHWSFDSVQDHLQKSLKYARIMADSYAATGRVCRWYHILFSPWFAFFKILIIKSGWRDGWRGWVIAGAKWLNVFSKYAFLLERRWQKQNQDRRT